MTTRMISPIEPGRFVSRQQPWLAIADATLVAFTYTLLKADITNMEVTYGK